MSERAAYSRVYWSIVDDPKFVAIYDDDHHLAAWLRLLLIADQSHPASAHLPGNVRKASVRALADVGLVDLTGSRYRIHGLDAERKRRRDAASRGGKRSDDDDPSAPQAGPKWDPDGPYTPGLRTRVGRDEDEPKIDEGEDAPPLTLAIDYIEQRSGRPWHSRPGSKLYDTLDADIRDFGSRWRVAADAVTGNHPDHGQLIFGASRYLHPIGSPTTPKGHQATKEEAERAFGG